MCYHFTTALHLALRATLDWKWVEYLSTKTVCLIWPITQLGESVDVAGIPQLRVFARYMSGKDIKEGFLFWDQLHTTIRGEDMLVVEPNVNGLTVLEFALTARGAWTGAGLVLAHVCRVIPHVKVTHWIIHKEALQCDTGEGFDMGVRVVNLIKKQPLQSRLFRDLCRETAASM